MTRLAQVVIRLRHGFVPNADDGQHPARVALHARVHRGRRHVVGINCITDSTGTGTSVARPGARSSARAVGETGRIGDHIARDAAHRSGVRLDHVGGIRVRGGGASRLFASPGGGSCWCRFASHSHRAHGDASDDARRCAVRARADLEGHLSAVGEAGDVGGSDGGGARAGGAEHLVHHSGDVFGADGAGGDAHAGGVETTGEDELR